MTTCGYAYSHHQSSIDSHWNNYPSPSSPSLFAHNIYIYIYARLSVLQFRRRWRRRTVKSTKFTLNICGENITACTRFSRRTLRVTFNQFNRYSKYYSTGRYDARACVFMYVGGTWVCVCVYNTRNIVFVVITLYYTTGYVTVSAEIINFSHIFFPVSLTRVHDIIILYYIITLLFSILYHADSHITPRISCAHYMT